MKYTVVHFRSNLPVLRPVTQRVDNAIQQFNYCPVGKSLERVLCYSVEINLSFGRHYLPYEQLGRGGLN